MGRGYTEVIVYRGVLEGRVKEVMSQDLREKRWFSDKRSLGKVEGKGITEG